LQLIIFRMEISIDLIQLPDLDNPIVRKTE